MNPINNRIIEYESKVLTTLLFDGSYVLHVVRHGHPRHLYPHVSLLHEGSFELFKKDLPFVIHRAQACLRPSLILFSFCPVCPVCLQKKFVCPVCLLSSPVLLSRLSPKMARHCFIPAAHHDLYL